MYADFLSAMSYAYYKLDFYEFCEVLGYRPETTDPFSNEKWQAFQKLITGLNRFNALELDSLVRFANATPRKGSGHDGIDKDILANSLISERSML